jgi:hypothetical protein
MKMIEIQTADDLSALEGAIARIYESAPTEDVTIRIARNLNAHFFKQSRVAALLATAAQRGNVTVRDWHSKWDRTDIDRLFRSSVGHLAAAIYARRLVNEKGLSPPFQPGDVANAVASDGGTLEPHNTQREKGAMLGSSLTFCAIDPRFSEPLSLSGLLYDKQKFVDELTGIKQRHLDGDAAYATGDLFDADSPDREIARYVFELYQNGYEHGNRRREDKKDIIPGLRFISIRKHVAANVTDLKSYTSGFEELTEYIVRRHGRAQALKYYEVAVSDQGLGMLDRFLIDRPEYMMQAVKRAERLNLLRRLLTESLTSKKGADGAGGGLVRAMRAAKELNGFVSIRTGEFWLYCSYPEAVSGKGAELVEVACATPTPPVAGTHFNALFPLRK